MEGFTIFSILTVFAIVCLCLIQFLRKRKKPNNDVYYEPEVAVSRPINYARDKREFACKLCSNSFNTVDSLVDHYESIHPETLSAFRTAPASARSSKRYKSGGYSHGGTVSNHNHHNSNDGLLTGIIIGSAINASQDCESSSCDCSCVGE